MGKIIKPYEVISQLGQGGMGVVYKARHMHFDDEIFAIKQLWQQFSQNPVFVRSFLEEGKTVRRLNHKNIVKVTDILEENGEYFIVMEFVEGRNLSDIIRRETGPIHRERAIKLFRQMLEGVAYIHNQPKPLIHRDLKPLNILVTNDDTIKITDFGIAKELDDEAGGHSTTVKGTPIYMSPEQIIDPKSVDIRTDIYSLGMTFYEMLCAKTPFSGNSTTTPTAVYAAIMNGNVPPPTEFYPGISDALSDFVMKAINKDRSLRFANANEMLNALDSLEQGGQTTVQGETGYEPPFEHKRIPEKPKIFGGLPTEVETFSPPVTPNTFKSKEMILVEGGTFRMGNDAGGSDEKPVHSVTLDSFLIGKYQVTQELWESVMENNPSKFKGAKRPVERVSWYDVVVFCNKLSAKEGLRQCYRVWNNERKGLFYKLFTGQEEIPICDFSAEGYRLPTEAEWEFAASGGNRSRGYKFSGSNDIDEIAWYSNNSGSKTHDVAAKKPNELGIYDMSGNVWEWCWDWKGDYGSGNQTNPSGPLKGVYRVSRGGSWYYYVGGCLVTGRGHSHPNEHSSNIGFRLVRTR